MGNTQRQHKRQMSIQLPLLLFSFFLCPVASQPGYKVKEVINRVPTNAELIATFADCHAAGKVFGLSEKNSFTTARCQSPPGCYWWNDGGGYLIFNTCKTSTVACTDSTNAEGFSCICADPCPIGNYQNEESSTT